MRFDTLLRLPYPTRMTFNDSIIEGDLVSITDDGIARVYKFMIMGWTQEMIVTAPAGVCKVKTYTDDAGITWARTLDGNV